MRKLVIGVLLATLLAAPAVACKGAAGSKGNSPTATTTTATPAQSSPAITGNAVSIQGFAFVPTKITVKVGDTITWTNKDSAAHTVSGAGWKSDSLAQGQTFSKTFATAGTFNYACAYHSSMTGSVVVQ